MPRQFMIDGHGPFSKKEAYDRLIQRVSFAQSRSETVVREILDQALVPELMGFVAADANAPDAKLAVVLEDSHEEQPEPADSGKADKPADSGKADKPADSGKASKSDAKPKRKSAKGKS